MMLARHSATTLVVALLFFCPVLARRAQKGQSNLDERTAKEQIRRQLQAQRFAARQRAFVDQLRAQSAST